MDSSHRTVSPFFRKVRASAGYPRFRMIACQPGIFPSRSLSGIYGCHFPALEQVQQKCSENSTGKEKGTGEFSQVPVFIGGR